MRLRRATPADQPLLEYWDSKPHVAAAGGEDDDCDWGVELTRDAEWSEILVAELEGRAIGLLQIIDPAMEETHYWGDVGPNLRAIDIWIGEEPDLGRGYGSAMMRLAVQRCFANPAVTAILIDPLAANESAIRFYRRLGFVDVGPRRFGNDDCLVLRLERSAWISDQQSRRLDAQARAT